MLDFIHFIAPAVLGIFTGILLVELKWAMDYCGFIGKMSPDEEDKFLNKMIKWFYVVLIFGGIGIVLIILNGVLAGA